MGEFFVIAAAILVPASIGGVVYWFLSAVEALQEIAVELREMNRLTREKWQDAYTTGRIEKPVKLVRS